jgi:hypothetical protein
VEASGALLAALPKGLENREKLLRLGILWINEQPLF